MILIASIGEGSITKELFMGSTVSNVTRIAPVPVLVVKYVNDGKTMRRVPIFSEKFAAVVLPTDFSASAEYIYTKILEMVDSTQEIILVHVLVRGEKAAMIKTAG
jgi:hypothetical protein